MHDRGIDPPAGQYRERVAVQQAAVIIEDRIGIGIGAAVQQHPHLRIRRESAAPAKILARHA